MIEFRKKGTPDVLDNPGLMPGFEAPVAGRIVRILFRQVFPPRPSPENPEYPLQTLSISRRGAPALRPRRPRRNQGSDLFPLLVRQHRFSHTHRITSDERITRNTPKVQDPVFQRDYKQLCRTAGFATASRTWLSLEQYVLKNAWKKDLKVTVFTGPVFRDTDKTFRGVRIPEEYWKIVVILREDTGQLSATGYVVSQADWMNDLEFVYGEFKTYQIPLKVIEQRTDLNFGYLRQFDPFDRVETRVVREISRSEDVRI